MTTPFRSSQGFEATRIAFRLPGATDRTTIIGATGTGKTTCGLWHLAQQRLELRPWVAIDFKRELLFDDVGFPPIQQIDFGTVPKHPGLYLLSPKPGEEDELNAWLWKIWAKENIGLYIDEAALMPKGPAMQAILQQGRSKRLPVIACMQRPVGVVRQFFSEASFFCLYRLQDVRDYDVIRGFIRGDALRDLPPHHWFWYDVPRNCLLTMGPVPEDTIVPELKARVPYSWHPFKWTVTTWER